MPNWCYNNVKISANGNEELLKKLQDAVQENKELFNQFVPIPESEKDNWYSWNCENWGTKWDSEPHNIDWDDDTVSFSMDTAWSPPVEFYRKMEELGYHVEAYYHEEGMGFVGYYEDGHDDYYDYSGMSADELEDVLPGWAEDEFGIIERMRDDEEYREEEEWAEYLADLERTDWYPVKTKPFHVGRYEVTTESWPYPQYCNWTGKKWERWEGDIQIRVEKWRGITEEQHMYIALDKLNEEINNLDKSE